MREPELNLLEDVQKSLTDPVYDILQNFSLKKSRLYYNNRATQWNKGNFRLNLANKQEEEKFPFTTLTELSEKSQEAQNLFNNLRNEDFFKGCEWCVYGQYVVVRWNRLKTFDEWLHDGIKDALLTHYKHPEEGVRKILVKKLGRGYYGDAEIHIFADGEISENTLKRLGQYESPRKIEGRDIDEDIKVAIKALYDMEENNNKL